MALKGRHWLALLLVFLLGIAVWVVARQTSAYATAGTLRDLRTQRSTIEAQRADLIQRIRSGSSRAELIPKATKMGLRLPVDSEIIMLRVGDAGRQ